LAHEPQIGQYSTCPSDELAVLNPLRSEEEAFRLLIYAIVVIAVIVGLILALRALT
jgi:hypothetical protein